MPANSNDVTVRFLGDTSNLLRAIGKADSALGRMSNNVAQSMNKVSTSMKVAGAIAGSAFAIAVTNGTKDAMQFEALMDGISMAMGDSANDFVEWQKTTGRAMGYSKLQGAELANELTRQFKQISSSQEDLTNKTTKMMETAAIIRARTGRSMEDVSNRIRSAMNMEADGADELGVNVRVGAIEAGKAYAEMANGVPWAELGEHQKKAILYQHILNSTMTNYGDTMGNNIAVRMGQFSASLADMRMALGQAFVPIVSFVLPALTALVQAISKALGWVRVFFATLFGYSHKSPESIVQKQSTAIGGLGANAKKASKAIGGLGKAQKKQGEQAKKAKKEQEGFLAGFDEVHTIPKKTETPDSGSGSGGLGGGGGAGGLGDIGGAMGSLPGYFDGFGGYNEKMDAMGKKVKELAEKFKKFLAPIGKAIKEYLGDKIKQVAGWWKENGDMIVQAMKNVWSFLQPIFKFLVEMIWGDVKHAIDGLLNFFMGLITFISGVFTGEWGKAWEGFKQMVFGALEAIWGIVNLIFIGKILGAFKLGWTALRGVFSGGITKLKEFWELGLKFMKDKGIAIWEKIKYEIHFKLLQLAEAIAKFSKKSFDNFISFLKNIPKWFVDNLYTPVKNTLTAFADTMRSKAQDAYNYFMGVFRYVANWFKDNVTNPMKSRIGDFASTMKTKASEAWNNLKQPFVGAYKWFLDKVINPIKNAIADITSGVKSGLVEAFKKAFNKGAGFINNAIGLVNKVPGVDIGYRIPKLARGGITNGKALAMVGDNVGGREVIAPLDGLKSMIANTMLQTQAFAGGGSKQQGGDIVLQVDGRTFARMVKPYIDNEGKRVGTNVRLNTF